MVAENKKFKVKGHNTTYTVGELTNCEYKIEWTNSSGESRTEYHTQYDVIKAFEVGDWYYIDQDKKSQPIKSDGGSSSYYELTITNKAGESIKCETGDVIRALVGNDFDFGNCVKALRRMYLATLGMGKEGTDIPYDANKIRWFLGEIERVNK